MEHAGDACRILSNLSLDCFSDLNVLQYYECVHATHLFDTGTFVDYRGCWPTLPITGLG